MGKEEADVERDSSLGPNNESTLAPKKGSIEKTTGFQHSYNALLWGVFGGALFAFCISRLPMLDVDGFYRSEGGIGEYFYIKQHLYKVGFIIHLVGILFANILAVFQFVPLIRHKLLIFHRINGYTAAGALAILVLIAFVIAWLQIKRLQIDQHRKWMLRALSMMASIVTSRIILHIATAIMADIGTYHEVWACDQLAFTINNNARFVSTYPECTTGSDYTTVLANRNHIENKASCARLVFGMSLWLAVAVHIVLMEFYIHFTPFESERLRRVSYERQLARGFSNPGSAGVTGDLISPMKWSPPDVYRATRVKKKRAT